MSPWKLTFKNLLFFRRQNTGIILAATLCGMVLTGSLTVGDSVRSTLRALAEVRIGEGDLAMLSPDGFFREDLAERIKEELPDEESVVAPIVLSRGMLTSPDGATRVSNIQVLGVDPRFWKLAPDSKLTPTGNESIEKGVSNWGTETFFVNERLGKRLKSETGERLILRMEEPSLFSRDAPLSGERDSKFVSMNKEFGGIIPPEGFGNFGLLGNQREPLTLFVSLSELQKKLFRSLDEATQSTNFANFLLLGIPGDKEIDLKKAKIAMDSCWTLEDAGIEIKKLRESDEWSVRTRQVFLSDSLVEKAKEEQPKASGVLTYLVNAIEKIEEGNKSSLIPYSMISGVAPDKVEFLSNQWKDHHIALNQWAATDLNASIGDSIRISFYTVGERRKLIEASRSFELQKILPMPKTVPEDQESDWTPRFPGLSDADSCGEWDTGIPIVHEVRVRDEDYWDEFRGSPKAFVSLKAAQEMWGNRWGSLTGIRANRKNLSREELGSQLRQNLKAEDAGLIIQSLRSDARESVETPVDFGQLFMGFSFFVIVAVLGITGMLFSFSMQQRNQQVGLLRALGWKTGKIRLVFWGEGALAAIMGSLLGVLLAASYGKLILDLLSGEWSGAVSGASFVYDARVFSMVIGWVSSATICFVAMVWSTRKQIKKEPRELLMSGNQGWNHELFDRKGRNGYRWVGWICLVSAVGLASGVGLSSGMASMTFFGAGALFLIGGLFLFRAQLGKLIQRNQKLSEIKELNQRNLGRRAGRSLVTVGSMAAGAFLVVSTGAFRKSAPSSSEELKSGMGGVSFWGESASPIYDDLNEAEAIELFDLNESILTNSKVIPLRLREGDDASCLNLNKALRPRIYGVKPNDFMGRFEFAEGNWESLNKPVASDAVPALVDQNTMMWALKMGIGDRIEFRDGDGKPFEVELVGSLKGSMLQGALFINEEDFLEKFKQQGGYRSFMLTGKFKEARNLALHLEDRMYQHGMEFRESKDRLMELQAVENTYLSIFQGLGGLGMLIGTCGLGLVVARNVVERGPEFGLFEALGFQFKQLKMHAFLEHVQLALWGILVGSIAAVLGIAPALFGGVMERPSLGFLWFFASLAILALFWIWVAVNMTLRRSQLTLLKNE